MFVPSMGPDRLTTPLSGPLSMPPTLGGGALDRLQAPAGSEAILPMLQMQSQSMAMLMQMMQILMTLMQNQGMMTAQPTPDNNQAAPVSDSGGGQASGVDASGGSQAAGSASVVDASGGPVTGSDLGKRIAQRAESNAAAVNTPGWCLREVGKVLREFGLPIERHASAYMALGDFRKSDKFQEIHVAKDQLKSLPAGAVVIWDKGPGLPHGHISIALGGGREASSTVRNQLLLSTQFWVFLPK